MSDGVMPRDPQQMVEFHEYIARTQAQFEGQPCAACDTRPWTYINLWEPSAKQKKLLGSRPGYRQLVAYPICLTCAHDDNALAMVCEEIMASAMGHPTTEGGRQ